MIGLDEEALICDFAEVYHVFDWRSLPVKTAAILALGLGPNSRIMRKQCGVSVPLDTLLFATMLDALRILVWQNTEDGAKGRNKPEMFSKLLTETPQEESGFNDIDEFKKWRDSMIGSDS